MKLRHFVSDSPGLRSGGRFNCREQLVRLAPVRNLDADEEVRDRASE
jgi:hypothetical protein